MKDKSRGPLDRWPCCYVIDRSGCDKGIPDLIELLAHDDQEVMRAVAAEALGEVYLKTRSTVIHDALIQAARTEKSNACSM